MTVKEKILINYGSLTAREVSLVIGCQISYVYAVWKSNGKPIVKPQRGLTEAKIKSCYGKVNARSAAKMLGVSRMYILQTWNRNGMPAIYKNAGKYGYNR